MNRTRIAQQTSTTLPLNGQLTARREAPHPQHLHWGDFSGPLQWLLEGAGWAVLRPAMDFVLLCAAVVIALGGFGSVAGVSSLDAPLLAMPALVMVLLFLRGLYRTRLRALILDSVVPVVSAVSVAAMLVAAIGMLASGELPTRSTWIDAWMFSLLAIGIGRVSMSFAQRTARRRRVVGKPVLIMGAGLVGSQVARRLEGHPEYGLAPIGFLDDDPRSIAEVGGRDVPVLGTAEDLDRIVRRTGVKNLIVAFSSVADARVSRLIQRCQELGIEVSVVPRMFDTINDRVGYDTVGGLPLLSFAAVNPKGVQFAIKDAVDRVAAALLLVLLSPVLLLAVLAVRLSSPGPVFFRQRRVGRDGAEFDLYKFRSMRLAGAPYSNGAGSNGAARRGADREEEGGVAAVAQLLPRDTAPGGVEGADRRTLIGRLLRRSSLDELPQLFNVVRGDMSLIGPRPERPEFVELFGRDVTRYGDRHRVKSGITGWAQVHGLRGNTSLAERVEWDNYYIAHWSLALDVKIVLLTFMALFRNAD
jgi:exopolysaccharide biosynthesis polyprenyl glycosylphosphotransferase